MEAHNIPGASRASTSSSYSSSSTLVSTSDDTWKPSDKWPVPCIYDEAWTKKEIIQVFRGKGPEGDPMPTLFMMQMIADAYQERRDVWEYKHKNPTRQDGDDPASYGPVNAAQVKVEEFLMDWRFLSSEPPDDEEQLVKDMPKTTTAPQVTFAIPSKLARLGMGLKTVESTKLVVGVLQKVVGSRKKCRRTSKTRRLKMVFPNAHLRKIRPALPSLPRIVPGFDVKQFRTKTLRRTTTADSIKLCAASIRKRKFTPAPEYEPTAEFLAELQPLHLPQYLPTRKPRIRHDSEEYRSLSWLKTNSQETRSISLEASVSQSRAGPNERVSTPFYVAILIFLLIQLSIFGLILIGCFVALGKLLSTVVQGCHIYLSFTASTIFGCSEGSQETLIA